MDAMTLGESIDLYIAALFYGNLPAEDAPDKIVELYQLRVFNAVLQKIYDTYPEMICEGTVAIN